MIGHCACLQENDEKLYKVPLWQAPAIKKKPPFFNVHTLVTHEIMCSKNAQCSTKE